MTLRTIATLVAGKLDPAQDRHAYEEGTWTPGLTFTTPGDLVVAYSEQLGYYTRIGRQVFLTCRLTATTFTHSTASGNLQMTGLPLTTGVGGIYLPVTRIQGWTQTGYTIVAVIPAPAASVANFIASGSGVVPAQLAVTHMPSGTAKTVYFTGSYFV